ncbi:hypothetical protein HYT54_04810 [Candidatus Woesearchaeota archaeon]|nr:hypothetical protein [Candidatus Woesearchaeota archaeon]
MKKITCVLMLMVFIVSIVPVFSEETASDDSMETTAAASGDAEVKATDSSGPSRDTKNVMPIRAEARAMMKRELKAEVKERIKDKSQLEKAEKLSRAKQKELEGMNEAQIKARLNKLTIKKIKTAEDLKIRKIVAEKKEAAKEMYAVAKERYTQSKEEFKAARDRFQEVKAKGNDAQTIEVAKKVLVNAIDRLVEHMNKIKSQVESNENIDDNRAKSYIQDIDARISELGTLKAEAEAATTKEQLKEIAKKVRAKWTNFEHKAKVYSERVVTARVEGLVNTAKVLEKRLDAALAKIKENGVDVNVDEETAKFSASVEDAKKKVDQAKEKLEAARKASDRESAKKATDEAKELIKQARELLKQAHETLKEIFSKVREAGAKLEIDTAAEVEIETEAAPVAST